MRINGSIHPIGDEAKFTRAAWCQMVATRPEFRRSPPRESRNPFTGEPMIVHPPGDSANVVVNECLVGEVYWSMSDEAMVNVSVEPAAMNLVLEWAEVLGGEFRRDELDAEP